MILNLDCTQFTFLCIISIFSSSFVLSSLFFTFFVSSPIKILICEFCFCKKRRVFPLHSFIFDQKRVSLTLFIYPEVNQQMVAIAYFRIYILKWLKLNEKFSETETLSPTRHICSKKGVKKKRHTIYPLAI